MIKAPTSSVFRHGDGWAAFAVSENTARLRPVKIGQRTGTEVEIVEGITPGEQVIRHPSDRVQDGTKVEAR